jgi:hypothetical protein
MTSRQSNPFGLWTDLMFATGEMMLASAEVIGHRTGRMSTAQLPLSAKDQKEFTLMVQEKAEAGQEAALALAEQAARAATEMAMAVPAQMMEAAWGLASSRTVPQFLEAQMKLHQALVEPLTGQDLAHAAVRAGHAAVKPYHRRATANARRLSRKR